MVKNSKHSQLTLYYFPLLIKKSRLGGVNFVWECGRKNGNITTFLYFGLSCPLFCAQSKTIRKDSTTCWEKYVLFCSFINVANCMIHIMTSHHELLRPPLCTSHDLGFMPLILRNAPSVSQCLFSLPLCHPSHTLLHFEWLSLLYNIHSAMFNQAAW